MASWLWRGSGGPTVQEKGCQLQAYWALAVHMPGAGMYLGFIDRAVESVVFLIIEQAEIQRPQRGCKGEKMLLIRRAQQTLHLPLSTKGVDQDTREMAADIIKPQASSYEPCYKTRLRAGRLEAIPTLGRRGWHGTGRGARGMNDRGSPGHCGQRGGFASMSFHLGHVHRSAAPLQPAASRPSGAEGSSPGRCGHGWDTAAVSTSPPSSAAGIPRTHICTLTPSNK